MRVLLARRYGAEWLDVREFVRPHTVMVDAVVRRHGPRTVHGWWTWVATTIRYPFGAPAWEDLHVEQAYWRPVGRGGRSPLFRYVQPDYWEYPSETLRDGVGDCKDTAILLTSILRHLLPPDQVVVSVGWFTTPTRRFLHAWTTVRIRGRLMALDTTINPPPPPGWWIPEHPHYRPFFRFNDQRTWLLDPAAARAAYGTTIHIAAG